MKVLKKGRKQKGRDKEYTCTGKGSGGCGAILLVEEGDLWQYSVGAYKWSHEEMFTCFKCCLCGVRTDVY